MKLRFAAEILLKLRKRDEEAVRLRFSKTSGEVEAIEVRIAKLRRSLQMHKDALRDMLPGGTDAMNLRLYDQCISDVERLIVVESRELEAAKKRLDDRRTRLQENATERKALTTLKDRQADQYAINTRRRDTRQWDESHVAYAAAQEASEDQWTN